MDEKGPSQGGLRNLTLVVGWNKDSGKLVRKVMEYLSNALCGEEFTAMELKEYFSFAGVAVEDGVIQFPECKFYLCKRDTMLIFKGNPPQREWYRFLNSIMDVAEGYGVVKELYTIGGMVGLTAHTKPRDLFAVSNGLEMKGRMSRYLLKRDMEHHTPAGQRPTLNAFLLWMAERRNIPGANLWVSIPFYLVSVGDAEAQRAVLEFFNRRFNLGIDFEDLDEQARRCREKIAQARMHSLEIDGYINRLERDLNLSEEENAKLIKDIERIFKESD